MTDFEHPTPARVWVTIEKKHWSREQVETIGDAHGLGADPHLLYQGPYGGTETHKLPVHLVNVTRLLDNVRVGVGTGNSFVPQVQPEGRSLHARVGLFFHAATVTHTDDGAVVYEALFGVNEANMVWNELCVDDGESGLPTFHLGLPMGTKKADSTWRLRVNARKED